MPKARSSARIPDRVKRQVMIAGNHNLVHKAILTCEPLRERLDFFRQADIRKVAGVQQDVAARQLQRRVLVVRVADANKAHRVRRRRRELGIRHDARRVPCNG
jgi:hypothetical protein